MIVFIAAVIALPDAMAEHYRGYQEQIVFFKAPRTSDAVVHLGPLLTAVWCINAKGLVRARLH